MPCTAIDKVRYINIRPMFRLVGIYVCMASACFSNQSCDNDENEFITYIVHGAHAAADAVRDDVSTQ